MAVYHQMGHDSDNLIAEIQGYSGAILSPLNVTMERTRSIVGGQSNSKLDFIFDPQLYLPRTERETLRAWPYFPQDVDTADLSDPKWWSTLNTSLAGTCRELGVTKVCSPTIIPTAFEPSFFRTSVEIARDLADTASDLEVLQTLVVNLPELAQFEKVMQIASIASGTKARSVYVIFHVDQEPRREVADSRWMTGALRLLSELRRANVSTLVGFCGPEAILYTTAGADCCATGKFFNLRRFTPGRFEEPTPGGGQLPYWFEESLLAYLREADLGRIQPLGLLSESSQRNMYGQRILAQLRESPGTAWVGLSWRHYMSWFADVDKRLREGQDSAEALLTRAEAAWDRVVGEGLLMEEPRNDGRWVRPWRIALRTFGKPW